ncbi:hypothetical protein UlMin_021284 [Ulmus minor]
MEVISGQLSTLTLQPTIFDGIKGAQELDPQLLKLKEQVLEGKNVEFSVSTDEIMHFKGRLCIPSDAQLKEQLLSEAHTTPYSVHPGATKMYQDLKERFWWSGMKKEVAEYVAKCLTCQKVKAEHQRPRGELYQAMIGMVPYEALYGRKCRSPVHWYETGKTKFCTGIIILEIKLISFEINYYCRICAWQ